MSIKDLFYNRKILLSASLDDISSSLESTNYIEEYVLDRDRFVPAIDYSNPANFCFYGSAQKYYNDSISRIYNNYPYDGSKAEKLKWKNESSLIDTWIYDNLYPKTNGYAILSADGWGAISGTKVGGYGTPANLEYIQFKGGPNAGSFTIRTDETTKSGLKSLFGVSNVYDPNTNRESNLQLEISGGITLEFWLKKDSFDNTKTEKEVIFDLWNGEASSSNSYGRMTLEVTGTSGPTFLLTLQSGSSGFFKQSIASSVTTSSLTSWSHYAFSVQNNSSNVNVTSYKNGTLLERNSYGTSIGEITGSLIANIGALRTAPSGTVGLLQGAGKLSASLDEFRYWKDVRNSQEIGRNWWCSVGGGSNTDDANTELGVYYKFNEGIVGTTSKDLTVLDYSGRVTNGYWAGYSSNSRNTGSAITAYFTELNQSTTEELDPIIYKNHPDVATLISNLEISGSQYDYSNQNSIYYTIPSWIVDEDDGTLANLIQIMASYLDYLNIQVKYLPRLKDAYDNLTIENKPYPFSKKLLSSLGIQTPELFIDASIIETVLSKDEQRNYDEKLHEIKNLIYQNIYHNLTFLYKSKGTEKSLRNLLHCFGIDEELVKINMYTDKYTYEINNNVSNVTTKKKYINFYDADLYESSIYQYKDNSNVNSVSYISGTIGTSISGNINYVPQTVEAEIYFPQKIDVSNTNYITTYFTASSLFGLHTAKTSSDTDLTWNSNDYANFQVYAVRRGLDSNDAYFAISSSSPFPVSLLTSSYFKDVYTNQKWNFSVSIKPNKSLANFVSGSELTSSTSTTKDLGYTLEFYGVNYIGDSKQNSFVLTSSISYNVATNFLQSPKRLYVGAERTNFTGSIIKSTDIGALSARYWLSDISQDEVDSHAKDPLNYGTLNPTKNAYLYQTSLTGNLIPTIETLILDWQFSSVSSSDSSGNFTIQDTSSGSISDTRYPTWFNNIKQKHHTAIGDNFIANSTVFRNAYLFSARQRLPEVINSSDMVSVLSQDDLIFTRNTRPNKFILSIEKNMYQTISEEMLHMFSTLKDFNNLLGNPVNKYRTEYKELSKFKQLFFEKVQNEPDLDKFLDFYKWIDLSIGSLIQQFIPASAESFENIQTIVESHLLERNKYQHKFPTLETKLNVLEAGAETINRHLYNWRTGYRPLSNDESDNCFYWNQRAERNVAPLSSSVSSSNFTRGKILDTTLQVLNRSFTTPYRFKIDESKAVQGGVNFDNNKNLEFATVAIAPHGPLDTDSVVNIPANYLFAGIPNTSSLLQDCNDVLDPNKKTKYHFTTVHGRDYLSSSLSYGEVLSSKIALPANFISGTVNTGYQSQVSNEFMSGVIITNIHNDTYGSRNEVPIQGPFTNQWVGGRQSRHVPLNQGTDTYTNRPEAWKILMGIGSFSGSYQTGIGFVGADYPYPEGNEDEPSYPVRAHLRATYLRDETAKRSVNIKNIQSSTGSLALGNYRHGYEVVHSVGSTTNNRMLVDAVNPTINTELYGILRTDITDGRVDYELPTRARSETIIVSRFSAPGDYRTNSRGYLTRYSEETSPYNALPFRNRQIIGDGRRNAESMNVDTVQYPQIVSGSSKDLNTLLTIPSAFGGYQSGSATIPSLHKIQRNSVWVTTSSINYDSGFVTHQIPQKDTGYAWITASIGASIESGEPAYYGHVFSKFTTPSASTSVSRASTIISSSVFGAYIQSGILQFGKETGPDIPVDFAGLNTIIYESSSNNTLGEPTSAVTDLTSSLILGYQSTGIVTLFNSLLLNRNGPYGYPTFKQTRISEHRVAKNLRNSNTIALDDLQNNTFNYIEPVLNTNYPLVTYVKDTLLNQTIKLTHTYFNNLQFYSNEELEQKVLSLNGNRQVQAQTYDNLLSLIQNNNRYEIERINVTEVSYPSAMNESLNSTRERIEFDNDNNYWKDSPLNRISTSKYDLFGTLIPSQSIWLLDPSINGPYTTGSSTGAEGVLQNAYSTFHNGNNNNITSSARYTHTHNSVSQYSTKSKTARTEILRKSSPLTSSTDGIYNGNSTWYTNTYSNKKPFYDSYELWLSEQRAMNQGYSIVPEYVISDKLNSVLIDATVLSNEVEATSFSVSRTNLTSSLNNSFDKYFSSTPLNKSVDIVNKSISNVGSSKVNIKIKCDVLKKFLPYEGFYPAQRALDLATQFSSSYASNITFFTGSTTSAFSSSVGNVNARLGLRSIYTPLFAPGILFNTIKSGIAVDFPILTSSLTTQKTPFTSGVDAYDDYQISNNNFDLRLPFETILNPENTLKNINIIDMEPHISASINATASWNGNGDNFYKLMANNYASEIVNFYLGDNGLTSLQSKSAKQFKKVDSSKKYRALVKMYKSIQESVTGTVSLYPRPQKKGTETITMYSRPTAFGPPVAGGTDNSTTSGTIDALNGYNAPFTPPYYDGEAWALLTYTPSGSGKYVPSINEILSNTDVKYLRYEFFYKEDGFYGESGKSDTGAQGHPYLNENAMQLSASLNIFDLLDKRDEQSVYNLGSQVSATRPREILRTEDNGSKIIIQTKFETPILNFIDDISNIDTGSNYTTPIGMWHQYGKVPTEQEGIYLQITDIPRNYITYGTEQTIATDASNILQTGSARNVNLTGSLVDILGFDTTPQKLGKVANEKKVKEAIILVPYYLEAGGIKKMLSYNPIVKQNISKYISGIDDNSLSAQIKEQIEKLKSYVVPPHLDFINNPVDPVSMYVFEFDYTFTQQDLVNMWQNVLPESSVNTYTDSATITHELNTNELMDKNILSSGKEIKFMVFKLKQKAKTNYEKLLLKNENNNNILEEKYSYNWPYDYFSIVESAKIVTEFEVINSGST